KQGPGKSEAIRILAVRREWFSDGVSFNTRGREMLEALKGKWLIEFGELKGLKGSLSEKSKATLSRWADRGRPAYARFQAEVERLSFFCGTKTSQKLLLDSWGNRRYWPVHVTAVDLDALKRDRDQLWAEAVVVEAAWPDEEVRLDPKLWP